MKPARCLFENSILILLFLLLVTAFPQSGAEAAGSSLVWERSPSQEGPPEPVAGNYCVGCHLPADPRLQEAAAWRGGVESAEISPCPAVQRIQEELYYTERLMLAIDNSREGLPESTQILKVDSKLAAAHSGYSRLLDTPTGSLEAFVNEAQSLRFRLGKIYTEINGVHEARKTQQVLIAAVLATLIVLLSLGWGYWNSRSFAARAARKPALPWKAALFAGAVFVVFALPIFGNYEKQAALSAEEQAVKAVLDGAKRSGSAAERAQARAWMLARVAAAWSGDAARQSDGLEAALAAEWEAQANAAALWGQTQTAREAAGVLPVFLEEASLVARQLAAFESRVWSLRMIAQEWAAVNPERAAEILEQAQRGALAESGLYRDLDLVGVAAAWLDHDEQAAWRAAQGITDPALKAWALRTIAAQPGSKVGYEGAVEAARTIEAPVRRAHALGEIGRQANDEALFIEAAAALDETEGAARDFGLARLAGASGDARLADRIESASAQAYALFAAGQYQAAWEAAAGIGDPYERARAQSAIAFSWKNSDAAQEIRVAVLRDRALRLIAVDTGDAALAQSIQSPYDKIFALAGLGEFEAAWEAGQADPTVDDYSLALLGTRWAGSDPQSALAVIDALDREVDKAAVLRAAAAATRDAEIFERALAMALAARVRGDALSPVEASAALARLMENPTFTEAAFAQAYEAAQRISIK